MESDEVKAAAARLRAGGYPPGWRGAEMQDSDRSLLADAYLALGDLVCQEPTIDDGIRWMRSVFVKEVQE